jgi:hypothetical protein
VDRLFPSPSRTLVTPYCKRIHPGRRATRSHGFPLFVSRLAPTHLGWGTQRQFTRRSRDPPGTKRRQLARQVGDCCVLTNSFPSSSRWVVSSNLSSLGRCSVSGVSSSCPSTAATTWYSFLRHATATTVAISRPAAAESTTSSPHGGRAASGSVPSPSPPQEEEAGQPWPSRRRHLVGCRASRRHRRPSGGHVRR